MKCSMRLVLTLLVVLALPGGAYASVVVNEVSWMGTSVSANHEWIELYNSGASSVSLDGWRLVATDGAPDIALSGTLSAGGYLLLERTSDETVPGVIADLLYTGAMGNAGEILEVYDGNGARIDRVDGSDDWAIGGSNETKDTVQRSGTGWVTAIPTPRRVNTTEQTPPPVESQSKSDTVDSTTQPSVRRDDTSTGNVSTPNILRSQDADLRHLTKVADPMLSVSAGVDRAVHMGVPTSFIAEGRIGSRDLIADEAYVWNMGDGTILRGREVSHMYQHPGTYVVAVEARATMFREVKRAFDTVSVDVSEVSVSVNAITDTYIELTNSSADAINLSGVKIAFGAQVVELPQHTYIAGNGTVRMMRRALGINPETNIESVLVVSAAGYPIARFENAEHEGESFDFISDSPSLSVTTSLARMTTEATSAANAEQPASVDAAAFAASIAEVTSGYMLGSESTTEAAGEEQDEASRRPQTAQAYERNIAGVAGALPGSTQETGLWAWVVALLALVAGASVVLLGLGRAQEVASMPVRVPSKRLVDQVKLDKEDSSYDSLPPAEAFTIIEADAPADNSSRA